MANLKFSRVQRADKLIPELRAAGVGLHVLPTYLAISDHADNQTGVAYPSITRLASILGVCRRTVERHVKLLSDAGICLKSAQRRQWHHRVKRHRGRWGVCRFAVVAVPFFSKKSVRHRNRTVSNSRTKQYDEPSNSLPKSRGKRNRSGNSPPGKGSGRFTEDYEWFFR